MKTMKKIEMMLMAAIVAFGMTACTNDNSDNPAEPLQESGPTAKEKAMVTEPMIWMLDSILVIYNYQTPIETYKMLYAEEDFDGWSYRLYPCTYQFPDNLMFNSAFDDETYQMSQMYNEDFCKYTCITVADEKIVSAGYLCYYRDMFTFRGLQQGGMVEFMIREADTKWDSDNWTCTYNASVEEDGTVLERNVEYYSRVYPRQ